MDEQLNYNQWTVTFNIQNCGTSWVTKQPTTDYISIDIVGNWIGDHAIFYNIEHNPIKIAYDTPELLSKGLKKRILAKCEKIKVKYDL